MTIIKKQSIKHVETKNGYIPHKIRSHPFYFIDLPLRSAIFFTFYWIVLVPVIYYILLTCVPDFPPFVVWYFLAMFGIYLIIMGIFIAEWRLKRNREDEGVFYIKYETPDSVDNLDQRKLKSSIEWEPDEVVLRHKEKEVLIPPEVTESVEVQKRAIVDESNRVETTYLYELKQKIGRPKCIVIDEINRPTSQSLNSPLTPRDLFFIDMIELANKSMRDITEDFIEKERLYYIESGPVVREYSESFSTDDDAEQSSLNQYSVEEQVPPDLEENYPSDQQISTNLEENYDQRYPKMVRYRITEHSSPRNSTDEQYEAEDDKIQDVTNQQEEYQYPIDDQYLSKKQAPLKQHSTIPEHSRLTRIIEEYSIEKEHTKPSREREYFIANVVPHENCVSSVYLFVDETKSDEKPTEIIVKVQKS